MPSTLLVKTVVAVDCCMFACIGNDLQLLTKAVGLIYASHCTLLYFVVLVRRRRAIGARKVTRIGLLWPPNRPLWTSCATQYDAVHLSFGSALDSMPCYMGTPVVESSTATIQRNQLTFHRFLQQQLHLHPLPLFTRAECRSAV